MPATVLPEKGKCTQLYHSVLRTTFCGIEHPNSTPESHIHQFLGIKYASIPARFRQSQLVTSYPPVTDASELGYGTLLSVTCIPSSLTADVRPLPRPICPQSNGSQLVEELLFGLPEDCIPKQDLKQDEFECLNLNITSPAGLNQFSRLPVMLWVHGYAALTSIGKVVINIHMQRWASRERVSLVV